MGSLYELLGQYNQRRTSLSKSSHLEATRVTRPSSLRNDQELCSSVRITDTLVYHDQESQLNMNTGKDLLLGPFSDDSVESELMRLHSLSGPPRFLITIVEETKEDLESEDGRSRGDNKSAKGSRSRSLSDLLAVETPYLTPLASPSFFTPPLTPSVNQIGFDHLFESSKDAEFNKIRSSPPPKFKFLQDAEEKLYTRKLMQEAEIVPRKDCFALDCTRRPPSSNSLKDEDDGPFITIIVDRNRERELNEQNHQPAHHPSSSSRLEECQWGSCGVICCVHSSCLPELSDTTNHSGESTDVSDQKAL
uniref:Uncharacterized protein n=1 Tax=Salix viminalis TaxID=40686 RepID=A0A6N2NCG9_SALVM